MTEGKQDVEVKSDDNATEPSSRQTNGTASKFGNIGGKIYNQGDGQWVEFQYADLSQATGNTEGRGEALAPRATVAVPPHETGMATMKFQNLDSSIGNQGDNQRIGRQTLIL